METWDEELEEALRRVRMMQISAEPHLTRFREESDEVLRCIAQNILDCQKDLNGIKGAIEAREPSDSPEVCRLRQLLTDEFSDSSLSGVYPQNPPIRGPFGEAKILLKPDA